REDQPVAALGPDAGCGEHLQGIAAALDPAGRRLQQRGAATAQPGALLAARAVPRRDQRAGLGDHLAQPRARSLILSHARIPARPGAAVRAVPASRWTARERGGSVALGGSVEGGVVARLVD